MSEINTENIGSTEPVSLDTNGSDNLPITENNIQENETIKSEEDVVPNQTEIIESSKEEVLDSNNEEENKDEEYPRIILEDDINIGQPQEAIVEEVKIEEVAEEIKTSNEEENKDEEYPQVILEDDINIGQPQEAIVEEVKTEEVAGEIKTSNEEEVITKEEIEPSEEQKAEEQSDEQSDEQQEKPSWYIIHTYSGHEFKVKERIEQRAQAMNMTNKITKIIVPEEESVEIKNNKRLEKTNKMFPGYVFVEMVLDNESWFLIRKIPGVSKFLGPKSTPLPVTEKEMLRVLQQTGVKTKKIEVDFEIGELIKVISGPFRGYQGGINELYPDRGKLKAKISIFGRETPVELDFDQVEKVIK